MARPFAVLLVAVMLALAYVPAGSVRAEDDPPWQAAPAPAPEPGPAADPPPVPAPARPSGSSIPDDAKCVVSGEPWKASSTRVDAILRIDGQSRRGLFLNLAYMLIYRQMAEEAHHQVGIESVRVLDFPTFGTDHEQMIDINEDWSNVAFLKTDKSLPGSKEPYFAAFSSTDDLQKAMESIGGKPKTYEEVMKMLLKALDGGDSAASIDPDPLDGMRKHPKFGD